jgi:hypothetical protein
MIKFVTREILISKCYQVDFKEIKRFFQWWAKYQSMFPTVGSLVCQILRIVGSQIEIKKIFSLVEILTNLRRCRLQSKNLKRLIFVRKKWAK